LSEVPKPAKRLGESQRRQARDGRKQDPFPPINSSPCQILLSSSFQSLHSCRDRQSDGAVNCAAPYPPSTSCYKSRRLRPFDDHRNATDTVTTAASRSSLYTSVHRSRKRPATRSNTSHNVIRLPYWKTTILRIRPDGLPRYDAHHGADPLPIGIVYSHCACR